MVLMLRRYLLHLAGMSVLLAAGATEGECGCMDRSRCGLEGAPLSWWSPLHQAGRYTLQASPLCLVW